MKHSEDEKIKVMLVDDHELIRRGLASLLEDISEQVVVTLMAKNGLDMIDKLTGLPEEEMPDIVLLDIHMPEMDGFASAEWLRKNKPGLKIMALSTDVSSNSILGMLRSGAKGYILKDSSPSQFLSALQTIFENGFYSSDLVSRLMMDSISDVSESVSSPAANVDIPFTPREMEFLKLACTELSYKEIADKMSISPRTVDGLRDSLFEKCNVGSRVGLSMYAIRNRIVTI